MQTWEYLEHSIPKNMTVYRVMILQRVLSILDMVKELQKLLIYHRISSVIKLFNATDEDYQSLVDKDYHKLFLVYKDQIVIFQAWYQDFPARTPHSSRLK